MHAMNPCGSWWRPESGLSMREFFPAPPKTPALTANPALAAASSGSTNIKLIKPKYPVERLLAAAKNKHKSPER